MESSYDAGRAAHPVEEARASPVTKPQTLRQAVSDNPFRRMTQSEADRILEGVSEIERGAADIWELASALREERALDEAVIEAARRVLAQYQPHEIADAEAELRDALAARDAAVRERGGEG